MDRKDLDWKRKTVSMGQVEKETFGLTLATVTVSENRIVVDPNDVEDWGRIIRELGEDTVLREVHWQEVEDVSTTVEGLYYPHIDIRFRRQPTGPQNVNLVRERRIYFIEDEQEELERCLKTIKQFWNEWRQNQVVPRPDRREPDDDEPDEVVELEDALREQTEEQEQKQVQEQEQTQEREQDADTEGQQEAPEQATQAPPVQDHDQDAPADTTSASTERGQKMDRTVQADSEDNEMDDAVDGGTDDDDDEEDKEIDEVVDQFLSED